MVRGGVFRGWAVAPQDPAGAPGLQKAIMYIICNHIQCMHYMICFDG